MPTVIVTETTVYTLDELTELAKSGDKATKKAAEKAREKAFIWQWEGWEPVWFREELIDSIQYEFPWFDLDERAFEWDLDRKTTKGQGHARLLDYLTHYRLRNKYRLLWNVLKQIDLAPDVAVDFQSGYRAYGNAYIHDTMSDMECWDEVTADKERHARIIAQLEAVERELENSMKGIHNRIIEWMRAEEDWRMSDEFIFEEARCQDLKFTQDGSLYDD